jgi:hypothetical protein
LGQLTNGDQQVAVKILDIGKFKTIDVKKERATHKVGGGWVVVGGTWTMDMLCCAAALNRNRCASLSL